MRAVITVLLIVVLVALWGVRWYFLFGRGRQLTIGNPNHWWNHPISRAARRIIGGVGAAVGVILLILELTGATHPVQGYVGSVVLIVLGLLLAFGVLPRERPRRDDA